MSELKAALQKHFSQVTQAQLVPQALQHDEQIWILFSVLTLPEHSCMHNPRGSGHHS
jgi:hypothetical protein